MKTYIISLAIALIIGGFIGWSLKPDKKCPEPNTLIEYRYVTKTDTLVKPIFKTIVKKDTIKFRDTLFIHEETNYIAEVDTTYQDSLLKAKIQYVSDIPLSPKSYFNLDFKVREKIITNTITEYEETSFWYKRFPVIIGGGLGMDLDRKIIVPTVGIYIGIRIN